MEREPLAHMRRIAEELHGRANELRAQGVEFKVFARRRPGVLGLRYDLDLHVWPRDGFDTYSWTGYRRRWFRPATQVADVGLEAGRVLNQYAAGWVPDGRPSEG